MKIPLVPSRREPPRVLTLFDLRRFVKARTIVQFSSGPWVGELTYCNKFVLFNCSFCGQTSCRRLTFQDASLYLLDHLYLAVRGASEEF